MQQSLCYLGSLPSLVNRKTPKVADLKGRNRKTRRLVLHVFKGRGMFTFLGDLLPWSKHNLSNCQRELRTRIAKRLDATGRI